MDKEKQIEEMAKLLHLNYDMPYEFARGLAEFLIDEGYRKASDVAREVLDEIFLRIREEFSLSELGKSALSAMEAELKKKYTQEK